jgi:hypothetical protein
MSGDGDLGALVVKEWSREARSGDVDTSRVGSRYSATTAGGISETWDVCLRGQNREFLF